MDHAEGCESVHAQSDSGLLSLCCVTWRSTWAASKPLTNRGVPTRTPSNQTIDSKSACPISIEWAESCCAGLTLHKCAKRSGMGDGWASWLEHSSKKITSATANFNFRTLKLGHTWSRKGKCSDWRQIIWLAKLANQPEKTESVNKGNLLSCIPCLVFFRLAILLCVHESLETYEHYVTWATTQKKSVVCSSCWLVQCLRAPVFVSVAPFDVSYHISVVYSNNKFMC